MQEFSWQNEVRDYELDAQGIVNNAVYLNYFEHARHKYIQTLGIDFIAYHRQGYDFVAIKALLNYHQPLHSGDQFVITVKPAVIGRIRMQFEQELRLFSNELCATAVTDVVCIHRQRNRPCMPDQLKVIIDHFPRR